MPLRKNLVGERFGRLTVTAQAPPQLNQSCWFVKCDCGSAKIVRQCHLIGGRIRSCGCLVGETARKTFTTHGGTKSPVFSNWKEMLSRCYNHNNIGYHNYGGRGIRVCEFLRSSPLNLMASIGEKPTPSHTIERIDVNGHYACGICSECLRLGLKRNVTWATRKQQSRNRRDNRRITIDGETKCISEWSEQTGIPFSTICYRLSKGHHPLKP